MAERIISLLLLLIAVIHVLPLVGVISGARVASLYDIAVADANLEILMRHRAVLFGILALLFGWAAFRPVLQPLAFTAAFVSIVSFLALAWSVGDFNEAIKRVVIADVMALAALLIAIGLYLVSNRA